MPRRKSLVKVKDEGEEYGRRFSSRCASPSKEIVEDIMVYCGKCKDDENPIEMSIAEFRSHVSLTHGGLARPLGESQEFDKQEFNAALKVAFTYSKKVNCYICQNKTFTSFTRLKNHLKKCEISHNDDIEEMTIAVDPIVETEHNELLSSSESVESDYVETKPKKRRSKRNINAAVPDNICVQCGKCETKEFGMTMAQFYTHTALMHGGLARPLGNSQEFDEQEISAAIKYAFFCSKTVVCYRCLDKTFTTLGGLRYHLKKCDKTQTNIEAQLVKCEFCYRYLFPESIKKHQCLDKNGEVDFQDRENSCRGGNDPRNVADPGSNGGKSGNKYFRVCANIALAEKKFRSENFYYETFDALIDLSSAQPLVPLTNPLPTRYIPPLDYSNTFSSSFFSTKTNLSDNKSADKQTYKLERFQGQLINNIPTLFAGGPIWAAAWCPDAAYCGLVALSTSCKDAPTEIGGAGPGLIQLWNFGKLLSANTAPVFVAGIIHDYGDVKSLVWCPSLAPSPIKRSVPTLGLLASACGDGSVRIFVISEWKRSDDGVPIYFRLSPAISLIPLGHLTHGACLCVNWYRGKEHRVIVGGFEDGTCSLWDVSNFSKLLVSHSDDDDGILLAPYRTICAHTKRLYSVDLNDISCDWPRYLLTCSADGSVKVFDMNNLCHGDLPLYTLNRIVSGDAVWLSHYPATFSFNADDSCNTSNHSYSVSLKLSTPPSIQPYIIVNSTIWSASYSPWLGSCVLGSSTGELLLFVFPQYEQLALKTNMRRLCVFRTELHEDETIHFVDEEDVAQINRNIHTGNGYFGNQLGNYVLGREDITRSAADVISINRLAVHPDKATASVVFSGCASGLGRLSKMNALDYTRRF